VEDAPNYVKSTVTMSIFGEKASPGKTADDKDGKITVD
jgi:hypothetical protein